MLDSFKNTFLYSGKYKTHSEAIVISCFFNPQNSPYRIKAFNHFYDSIKHLNHQIIECVIGDSKPQLPENKNIKRVYTESLLWHKETLLNKIISELPKKYKYIFWVDADVIFTNKDWLIEAVDDFENYDTDILQPFEYCVHLNKDELKPSFDTERYKKYESVHDPKLRHPQMWKSFCANNEIGLSGDENYDRHGHVGFAWGAKREVLEKVPLYDKALIGGADHIIAHAAAGHFVGNKLHSCIMKSFTDNVDEVTDWSRKFYSVVQGRISYVQGDLYHIWHGDIDKRQYLKRIQDFTSKTKGITIKDKNGLYVTKDEDNIAYMNNYFKKREVSGDDGFLASMAIGYMTDSTLMGAALGGNIAGAMLGDMMNSGDNSTQTQKDNVEFFGGGQGGGAGSGGSFETNNDTPTETTDNSNNIYPGSTFS